MKVFELEKRYVIGCHVMFYEIEMLPEYVHSLVCAIKHVKNPKKITIHFCWNIQEYLEEIDRNQISEDDLCAMFDEYIVPLKQCGVDIVIDRKTNDDEFYNIAHYRRDLNYNYCDYTDFIIWGETDSLFPSQMFGVIEGISKYAEQQRKYRYTITFSYRKNWDDSWKVVEHRALKNIKLINESQMTSDKAFSKAFMSYEEMEEFNAKYFDEISLAILNYPKFDGSCLVIASELVKMGVNIPHAVFHCAEDTAFGVMASKLLGNDYTQYAIQNLLRVHNRRHPKKRNYILNEDNPRGFIDKKGDWWPLLEKNSKYNLNILFNPTEKFVDYRNKVIHKILYGEEKF